MLSNVLKQLKHSIVFKLMLIFIIIIILIETVFFYFFLATTKNIVINKAKTLTAKSLDTTSESIDRLLDLMVNGSKQVNMNKEIINILGNQDSKDIYQKFYSTKVIDNIFLTMLTAFPSHNVYCTILGYNGDIYTSYDRKTNFDFKELMEEYSKYVIKNTYAWLPIDDIKIPLSPGKLSSSSKRFTVVSSIQEYPSSPVLGICITSIEHSDLKRLLSVPTSYNYSNICLSNDENVPVITAGSKDLINNFLNNYSMEDLYGSFSGRFGKDDYLINYKNLNTSSWKLIEIIPNSTLLAELNLLQKKLYMFILGTACVLFVITIVISFYVTKPIRGLSKLMQEVEKGNFKVKAKIKSKDEVGILCNNFNKMLDQINNLFAQVKEEQARQHELELESLQLQIRPHFLLNTLNSIRWIAIMSQADNVSKMISALSNLLKTSMNITEKFIMLEQELQNVKDYLYIQKIRYNGVFKVEFCVSSDILQCMVVKTILQPIVENSLIHGLDKTNFDSKIIITGEKVNENIIITVDDNGKGIAPQKLKDIVFKINDEGKTKSGIGLKNINQRLKMTFGEKYGINIWSKEDEGTSVEVKVPIIKDISAYGKGLYEGTGGNLNKGK